MSHHFCTRKQKRVAAKVTVCQIRCPFLPHLIRQPGTLDEHVVEGHFIWCCSDPWLHSGRVLAGLRSTPHRGCRTRYQRHRAVASICSLFNSRWPLRRPEEMRPGRGPGGSSRSGAAWCSASMSPESDEGQPASAPRSLRDSHARYK